MTELLRNAGHLVAAPAAMLPGLAVGDFSARRLFSDLLHQLAVHGDRCSPAATLMAFDAVLGHCADPAEIASIVEAVAEAVGSSPAEYWDTALDVFDTVVFTTPTRKVWYEQQRLFDRLGRGDIAGVLVHALHGRERAAALRGDTARSGAWGESNS